MINTNTNVGNNFLLTITGVSSTGTNAHVSNSFIVDNNNPSNK